MNNFVDLAVADDHVVLCGTELKRPPAVDVPSWRALWERARKSLTPLGSVKKIHERSGPSSMELFRRMAERHA
jgi:hypothetical protein